MVSTVAMARCDRRAARVGQFLAIAGAVGVARHRVVDGLCVSVDIIHCPERVLEHVAVAITSSPPSTVPRCQLPQHQNSTGARGTSHNRGGDILTEGNDYLMLEQLDQVLTWPQKWLCAPFRPLLLLPPLLPSLLLPLSHASIQGPLPEAGQR